MTSWIYLPPGFQGILEQIRKRDTAPESALAEPQQAKGLAESASLAKVDVSDRHEP
jgi:hypothetical protein